MLACFTFYIHSFVYFCVFPLMSMWSPEDSPEESVLSLHHVGSKSQTHVMKLSGKHLYALSHFASLLFCF